MDSVFARTVFERLLADPGAHVAGLVAPAAVPRGFPRSCVAGTPSNLSLALNEGVEIIDHRDDDALCAELARLRPELIVVACYPRHLAPRVAACARFASVNLHPSLLPAYRGPDPLFWQLRDGASSTGVTIHRVEQRLDAGAIAAASPTVLPAGATREALERVLGDAAARLLLAWSGEAKRGRFTVQDESRATSHPMPRAADRVLSTSWSLARAWNFLRGAAPAGSLFEIDDGRRRIVVRDALECQLDRVDGIVDNGDGTISAGFDGGAIRLRTV